MMRSCGSAGIPALPHTSARFTEVRVVEFRDYLPLQGTSKNPDYEKMGLLISAKSPHL